MHGQNHIKLEQFSVAVFLSSTFPKLIRVGQCHKTVCFLSKRWTI